MPSFSITDLSLDRVAAIRHIDLRQRVARELTDLVRRRGKPGMIVSDHGTEHEGPLGRVEHNSGLQGRPASNEDRSLVAPAASMSFLSC